MPTAKKKPAKKSVPTAKRSAPPAARAPRAAAGRGGRAAAPVTPPKPRWSEQYEEAVKEYGRAIGLVNQRDWAAARGVLIELIGRFGREADLLDIVDRARAYIQICDRNLAGAPKMSAEDAYLEGIYHSNRGEYEEALRLMRESLEADPASDKTLYAMAAVQSLKGDRAGAIGSLKRAIEKDDRNRVYALNDSDFDAVRDEPEFINLVEPETASDAKL